jgi:hypothetical protein
VPAEYRPLHKYLGDRYASAVVLTFSQIEDLLGHALPPVAFEDAGWWTSANPDGSPSAQSHSWTQADRTATPNLAARSVLFERRPG